MRLVSSDRNGPKERRTDAHSTYRAQTDATLRALDTLAQAIEEASTDGAAAVAIPVGIHQEGPFLSHIKRGVYPPCSLQEPGIELFDRFQQAARGQIRLMTLAGCGWRHETRLACWGWSI